MPRNFSTQLAGQIGESLVVAELGRRGIVATSFAGNVPDIDLLAFKDGSSVHLQVKSVRTGSVSFDANRFLLIEFDGDKQIVRGPDPEIDGDLIYVFVRIGNSAGEDQFFILEQRQLQEIIKQNHIAWLDKHGGVRPKNPQSTHVSVSLAQLAEVEDHWSLVEFRLAGKSTH